MSQVATFKCDNCGKMRSDDTNHWRNLWEGTNRVLVIAHWNPAVAEQNGTKHACGESCTVTMIQRHMATGKLTE